MGCTAVDACEAHVMSVWGHGEYGWLLIVRGLGRSLTLLRPPMQDHAGFDCGQLPAGAYWEFR